MARRGRVSGPVTHPAAAAAAQIVAAGWPVVPIRDDTDEKRPSMRWRDPAERITEAWQLDPAWPRWAAICGIQRESDGTSLGCLDADGPDGAMILRSLAASFPGGSLVRTGRPGGLHLWVRLPADVDPVARSRFMIASELDWRAGDCIALLPGSLWHPVSAPMIKYEHVDGPPVAECGTIPAGLLAVITARARSRREARPRSAVQRSAVGPVRTDDDSAFERFLGAAKQHGRKIIRDRPGRAFVSCPTDRHPHGNRRPALLVTANPGGAGLHCFARECDHDQILAALGLSRADLFDQPDVEIKIIDRRP